MDFYTAMHRILQEDQVSHSMPAEKYFSILKNILDFYKKIKPP